MLICVYLESPFCGRVGLTGLHESTIDSSSLKDVGSMGSTENDLFNSYCDCSLLGFLVFSSDLHGKIGKQI